ncbi:MAG TPA: radical SAM family heme chaperone HemW [Burkholderiales bacterium]|nr:radical SAM family heme chaperone HemW [Burkholderiales bacterium]
MSTSVAPPASNQHIALTALPPLALYVHIPWCVRKCPYCDFNSHESRAALPQDRYVDALIADLESALPDVWGRRVQSVFFGGGTPSLFSVQTIDRLLSALRARLALNDAEITLEANPGTVETEKFRGFRDAGINRLSIGIQSFNDRHLRALGRIHDAREALAAIEIAKATFDNINLDVMYALPEQTPDEARRDVETALAADVSHLSFYHLTLEPNTIFHKYPPPLPDDDSAAMIHDMVGSALVGAGYRHYETSAYARTGYECRHNVNYWRFGDYLGIGAGAHAKISFADRIVREQRVRAPADYLRRVSDTSHVAERRILAQAELPFEFMLNTLRLTEGFDVSLFAERTGLPISVIDTPLADAERRGLLVRDHLRIAPTEHGRRFLNDLQMLFLSEKRARQPV